MIHDNHWDGNNTLHCNILIVPFHEKSSLRSQSVCLILQSRQLLFFQAFSFEKELKPLADFVFLTLNNSELFLESLAECARQKQKVFFLLFFPCGFKLGII